MINGSKGRARVLKGIRRRRATEAAAAGIDPTDRKAVQKFHDEQFAALCARLIAGTGSATAK